MTCTHPKYELPNDSHAKYRYESAMKHVEAAKAAGKSSEEIHAIFKKVMEFDPKNIDAIPNDEAHANIAVQWYTCKKLLPMVKA